MCGIIGFVRLNRKPMSNNFLQWFTQQAARNLERGPDAMGIVAFTEVAGKLPFTHAVMNLPRGRRKRQEVVQAMIAEHAHAHKGLSGEWVLPETTYDVDGVSINFRGIPRPRRPAPR
jgi:hypothetical protein